MKTKGEQQKLIPSWKHQFWKKKSIYPIFPGVFQPVFFVGYCCWGWKDSLGDMAIVSELEAKFLQQSLPTADGSEIVDMVDIPFWYGWISAINTINYPVTWKILGRNIASLFS